MCLGPSISKAFLVGPNGHLIQDRPHLISTFLGESAKGVSMQGIKRVFYVDCGTNVATDKSTGERKHPDRKNMPSKILTSDRLLVRVVQSLAPLSKAQRMRRFLVCGIEHSPL